MPILGVIDSAKTGRISTNSFESISTVTLSAGNATDITFSSIPSTYTHLQLRMVLRTTELNTQQNFRMQINSDTGNNYTYHRLYSNGSTVTSDAGASQPYLLLDRTIADNATANMFGAAVLDILDYANTNKNKSIRSLGGADTSSTSGYIMFNSGMWMSTSAITSLKIYPSSGNWKQYTQIALYGIKVVS